MSSNAAKLTTPGMLGTRAVAKRLGVHENTVRNWVKHGVLHPAERLPVSGYLRFTASEADRVAKLVGNLQPRQTMGGTGEITWWISSGHVHVGDSLHVTLSIPYEEWNEMVDRIGHRYPEADRATPP